MTLVSEERTGHILEGKVYYRNGKEIYSGGTPISWVAWQNDFSTGEGQR